MRYESMPPVGVPHQAWLRRRIAHLEDAQARRRAEGQEVKDLIDRSVNRAQLEIDNLKAQQTIGAVR